MSGDRIDPELLAAILDGTASPEEREGVMKTLAQSREAYAEFIEAAAVKRELDALESSLASDVRPISSPNAAKKTRTGWILGSLLVAAGIAAVVIPMRLGRDSEGDVIRLAQATRLVATSGSGSVTQTLGDGWDQPPWSVTRGASSSLASHSRAFRAGALYAELEVAAGASDSAAVTRLTESLADLVASVEAGEPIAARVRAIAGAPDFGGSTERAATARQLRSSLGVNASTAWFDLGVWAETARLAIAAGDTAFFAPAGSAAASARRILAADVAPEERTDWTAAIGPLRPLLAEDSQSAVDLAALDRAVRNAIIVSAR